MDPDPDDIIREVNEDSQDECAAEILRLKRKEGGSGQLLQKFKMSLTGLLHPLGDLITELIKVRTNV